MRSAVRELHEEYCAPRSVLYVKLIDTEKDPYLEPSQEIINSLDMHVDIVV